MTKLNDNCKERDTLIFGKPIDWKKDGLGGTESFEGLSLKVLKELKEKNFLDPEDAQNSAPSIEEMMEFMDGHKGFTAHGYVVSPDREDYRVSLEGVEFIGKVSFPTITEFSKMFGHADDLTIEEERLYCWFD